MTLRWWTRLALISAIAGFVASGPPSDFERSDVESPAKLSNGFATTLPVIETFKTTELVTTTPAHDPAEDSESFSARSDEEPPTTP
jgi:hypothetical protein